MLKKTRFALTIAALSSLSAFAAITAEQAISTAEQQSKAQAIGFKLEKQADKEIYAVNLLGENGFQRLLINREDGAVIAEKQPEFIAPAFSLRQAIAKAESLGKVVAVQYLDEKMMPHHRHGKGGKMSGNRPHDDKVATGEKSAAEKAPENRQPIYLLLIEKDGDITHHAISTADGSTVELPKGNKRGEHRHPHGGEKGERKGQ